VLINAISVGIEEQKEDAAKYISFDFEFVKISPSRNLN